LPVANFLLTDRCVLDLGLSLIRRPVCPAAPGRPSMQRVETCRFGANIRLPQPVTAGRFRRPSLCQKREGIKNQADIGARRTAQAANPTQYIVQQLNDAILNDYSLPVFGAAQM
jgi:hypothetical protein